MSITGLPDGEPGGGPMRVGVAVVDLFTGLYTCVAMLAALYRREKSGAGAHIDMALFDTQLAMLANQASNALVSGKDPLRQGNTHPNIVPYQPFDAADQPIIIAVGNERQFARLAEICGHPEWTADERFASQRRARRQPGRKWSGWSANDPAESRRPNGSSSSRRRESRPARSTASAQALIRRPGPAPADGADDRRNAAGRLAGAARRRARGFGPAAAGAGRTYRRGARRALGLEPSEIARLKSEGMVG